MSVDLQGHEETVEDGTLTVDRMDQPPHGVPICASVYVYDVSLCYAYT